MSVIATGEMCVACGGVRTDQILCEGCRVDPFAVEQARKDVAKSGRLDRLSRLYSPEYAFLRQGDVGELWDDIHAEKADPTLDFTLWRNAMSAAMVPRGARTVLEIGVGMGHAVRYLSTHRPDLEMYATDVSEHAIRRAAENFPAVHCSVAAIDTIPWAGTTFDVVLLLEVLEHVEPPRTLALLRTIHDRLSADGCLIVSVPLETVQDLRRAFFSCPHCHNFVHPIGHVRSYSDLEPILSELALSGFSVERRRGLAPGRYRAIPRQWLMRVVPSRVRPMVMIFRCRKGPSCG